VGSRPIVVRPALLWADRLQRTGAHRLCTQIMEDGEEVTVVRVPGDGHMVQETAVAAAAVATAGILGEVLARWDLSAGTVKNARRVLYKGAREEGAGRKSSTQKHV